MDPREFTYLKRVKDLQQEVNELEQKYLNCNDEFNNLLDSENFTSPVKLNVITDKMSTLSQKIKDKEKEIKNLLLMLSN